GLKRLVRFVRFALDDVQPGREVDLPNRLQRVGGLVENDALHPHQRGCPVKGVRRRSASVVHDIAPHSNCLSSSNADSASWPSADAGLWSPWYSRRVAAALWISWISMASQGGYAFLRSASRFPLNMASPSPCWIAASSVSVSSKSIHGIVASAGSLALS